MESCYGSVIFSVNSKNEMYLNLHSYICEKLYEVLKQFLIILGNKVGLCQENMPKQGDF